MALVRTQIYALLLSFFFSVSLFSQTQALSPTTNFASTNDQEDSQSLKELKEICKLVPFDSKANKAFHEYMTKIMKRLLPKHDFERYPVQFFISDYSAVSAFETKLSEGGKVRYIIAMTKGAIKLFEDEDSFAAILGHELVHLNLEKQFGEHKNSRIEEYASDLKPISWLQEAGYRPETYLEVMQKLMKLENEEESGQTDFIQDMLDVHGGTQNRIELVKGELTRLEKIEKGKLNQVATPVDEIQRELFLTATHISYFDAVLNKEYLAMTSAEQMTLLKNEFKNVTNSARYDDFVYKGIHNINVPLDAAGVEALHKLADEMMDPTYETNLSLIQKSYVNNLRSLLGSLASILDNRTNSIGYNYKITPIGKLRDIDTELKGISDMKITDDFMEHVRKFKELISIYPISSFYKRGGTVIIKYDFESSFKWTKIPAPSEELIEKAVKDFRAGEKDLLYVLAILNDSEELYDDLSAAELRELIDYSKQFTFSSKHNAEWMLERKEAHDEYAKEMSLRGAMNSNGKTEADIKLRLNTAVSFSTDFSLKSYGSVIADDCAALLELDPSVENIELIKEVVGNFRVNVDWNVKAFVINHSDVLYTQAEYVHVLSTMIRDHDILWGIVPYRKGEILDLAPYDSKLIFYHISKGLGFEEATSSKDLYDHYKKITSYLSIRDRSSFFARDFLTIESMYYLDDYEGHKEFDYVTLLPLIYNSFYLNGGSQNYIAEDINFISRLAVFLEKNGYWEGDLDKVITLYGAITDNGLWGTTFNKTKKFEAILEKIKGKDVDLDTKIKSLEKLLQGPVPERLALANDAVDLWAVSMKEKYGTNVDNTGAAYMNLIKEKTVILDSDDVPDVLKSRMKEKLSSALLAQEELSGYLGTKYTVSTSSIKKDHLAVVGSEVLLDYIGENSERIEKCIEFLIKPRTEENIKAFYDYIVDDIKESFDYGPGGRLKNNIKSGGFDKSHLTLLHENFWGADFMLKVAVMNMLLTKMSSDWEETFDYVFERTLGSGTQNDADMEIGKKALKSYVKAMKDYRKVYFISAMMIAAKQNQEVSGNFSIGEALAKIAEFEDNPIIKKLAQQLHSSPDVRKDIREAFSSFKGQSNMPLRSELWSLYNESVPKAVRDKISYLGGVLGAGKSFIVVEGIMTDGSKVAIRLLRPNVDTKAEAAYELITDAIKNMREYPELNSVVEILIPLLENAKEKVDIETKLEIGVEQSKMADKQYNDTKVTIDGKAFNFNSAKWLYYGEDDVPGTNSKTGYVVMELMPNTTFNSLVKGDDGSADLKSIAKANIAVELGYLLTGNPGDLDPHGDNRNVYGENNTNIGVFDQGERDLVKPSEQALTYFGKLLATAVNNGKNIGDILKNALEDCKTESADVRKFIEGINHRLLALNDYFEQLDLFSEQDMNFIYDTFREIDAKGLFDPVMRKSFVKNLSITQKLKLAFTNLSGDNSTSVKIEFGTTDNFVDNTTTPQNITFTDEEKEQKVDNSNNRDIKIVTKTTDYYDIIKDIRNNAGVKTMEELVTGAPDLYSQKNVEGLLYAALSATVSSKAEYYINIAVSINNINNVLSADAVEFAEQVLDLRLYKAFANEADGVVNVDAAIYNEIRTSNDIAVVKADVKKIILAAIEDFFTVKLGKLYTLRDTEIVLGSDSNEFKDGLFALAYKMDDLGAEAINKLTLLKVAVLGNNDKIIVRASTTVDVVTFFTQEYAINDKSLAMEAYAYGSMSKDSFDKTNVLMFNYSEEIIKKFDFTKALERFNKISSISKL